VGCGWRVTQKYADFFELGPAVSIFEYYVTNTREVFMYHYYWAGMHAYWWFFWLILWICFFSVMMPVRRSNWASYRNMQAPLQLLQRRYAAGEITSEEYEERRAKLLRDARMIEA
jgi:putative membrane protein